MNAFILDNPQYIYSIEKDRGVAELYQYLKYVWIIAMLCSITWARKCWHYVSLAMIFIYFLLDDSLQIHELVGAKFAGSFTFEPFWGLKLQDLGELMVSALMGGMLFLPLLLSFWKGNQLFRKCLIDIFILIFILIFFGVGVDMVHSMIKMKVVTFLLGALEDGGEMAAVSAIVAYVYYQLLAVGDNKFYICACIKNYFIKP